MDNYEGKLIALRGRLSTEGMEDGQRISADDLMAHFGPYLPQGFLDAQKEIFELRKGCLMLLAALDVFHDVGNNEERECVAVVLERLGEILGKP